MIDVHVVITWKTLKQFVIYFLRVHLHTVLPRGKRVFCIYVCNTRCNTCAFLRSVDRSTDVDRYRAVRATPTGVCRPDTITLSRFSPISLNVKKPFFPGPRTTLVGILGNTRYAFGFFYQRMSIHRTKSIGFQREHTRFVDNNIVKYICFFSDPTTLRSILHNDVHLASDSS